jgi:hypothetical protein
LIAAQSQEGCRRRLALRQPGADDGALTLNSDQAGTCDLQRCPTNVSGITVMACKPARNDACVQTMFDTLTIRLQSS